VLLYELMPTVIQIRNKSITSKAMQYRQNIVTRTPITRVELITISTLRPIFYVFENFCRKFANIVAPPTDGTAKSLVHCKAHLNF